MSSPDSMVIGCPGCGRRYRFDPQRFGRSGVRIRCRACQSIMRVDLQGDPPGAESATAPARPVALVADRDESTREVIASVLREAGHEVVTCTDGAEARGQLAALRPSVVFLNAYLPGVLGVTLCAQLKRHPEWASVRIVLVGSLYRRDRFVRDPHALYGADAFVDASGSGPELRRQVLEAVRAPEPGRRLEPPAAADADLELERLARIIAGDILLYNPGTAEREIASGRFFETFSDEIRAGEALVATRFPDVAEGRQRFLDILRHEISLHRESAGIPASAGR